MEDSVANHKMAGRETPASWRPGAQPTDWSVRGMLLSIGHFPDPARVFGQERHLIFHKK
jgi:hypothetical protein